jgi:transcriptional regulator with XRE-family HTH domain
MEIKEINISIDEENIDKIIASNLKIARKVKGLTLKDMGLILGITYQQCQKYETGSQSVPLCKLVTISKHLNLPINFFFEKFELGGRIL